MTTANELGRRIMAPVRRDLPSGTVTSLFTDVEGSTKPVHALGADSYAPALAEHRRILRQAFSGHGGVEVDTQGDAFFFAFPTAESAPSSSPPSQRSTGSRARAHRIVVGPKDLRRTRTSPARTCSC